MIGRYETNQFAKILPGFTEEAAFPGCSATPVQAMFPLIIAWRCELAQGTRNQIEYEIRPQYCTCQKRKT